MEIRKKDNRVENFDVEKLERSIKNFNINPTTEDKILTLSNYIEASEIIVIQAKLIGTE